MDKFYRKATGLYHITGLVGDKLYLVGNAMLFQLQLDKPVCHRCAVNRATNLLHAVGDRADMIFVPVGNEHTPQLFCILHQIGKIRNDQVYAVHIFIGKSNTAVHNDHIPTVFQNSDILADLVKTAKGNNFQFFSQKNAPFKLICIVKRIEKLAGACYLPTPNRH